MDLKCVFTNKSLIIGTNQQTSAREEWRHATAGVLVLTGSIVCAGAGLRAGRGVVTTVSIVTRTLDPDHAHTGYTGCLIWQSKGRYLKQTSEKYVKPLI